MPSHRSAWRTAWPLAALLAAPLVASAESALRLEWPRITETASAVTYDVGRHDVGDAEVRIERTPEGNLRLESNSGFTGADRTRLRAELEPVADARWLRPVWQESRSFDHDGKLMGTLRVDHREGVARCMKPSGELVGSVALGESDRVANVTLNLLFLPLVRQEVDEARFDLFFCGLGIRTVPFVAERVSQPAGAPLVEIRYGPNLGFASSMARAMLPKLSIWFAPDAPHAWMGHRLPLYGNGPEVFVVRKGVPTAWLGHDD